MVFLGIGEVIGGNPVGYIRDKYGNRPAYILTALLSIAAYSIIIAYNQRNQFDILAIFMVLVFGIYDSGL